MSRLVASELAKTYRRRQVVKSVSLEVESGEVVGLLGPNGAGKTTSFHMIVGLVAPDAGRITLDEADVTNLPIDQRARMGLGYLPQEASVFRKLTVSENILAILEINDQLERAAHRQRLETLLEEFNIGHIRDSLGMSLSGGERRRVEIARALAINPRFVLLDEPFAGVDPISVIDIQAIISRLKALGLGVLITDHNVRETLGICDRAYIVSEGAILRHGSADEVLADERVRKVYLGESFSL